MFDFFLSDPIGQVFLFSCDIQSDPQISASSKSLLPEEKLSQLCIITSDKLNLFHLFFNGI